MHNPIPKKDHLSNPNSPNISIPSRPLLLYFFIVILWNTKKRQLNQVSHTKKILKSHSRQALAHYIIMTITA